MSLAISRQEEHHKVTTFKDEYWPICDDSMWITMEKYVFDWITK